MLLLIYFPVLYIDAKLYFSVTAAQGYEQLPKVDTQQHPTVSVALPLR